MLTKKNRCIKERVDILAEELLKNPTKYNTVKKVDYTHEHIYFNIENKSYRIYRHYYLDNTTERACMFLIKGDKREDKLFVDQIRTVLLKLDLEKN